MNGTSPVVWYSKRQATIETSTFGSEFVAAKVTTETFRGLRYKLRLLGVPIEGPTCFFGNNMSVTTNIMDHEYHSSRIRFEEEMLITVSEKPLL